MKFCTTQLNVRSELLKPKTTIEEEVADLLSIAAKAAHKLSLNRCLYRYGWMDEISAEVCDLEAVADRLRDCANVSRATRDLFHLK